MWLVVTLLLWSATLAGAQTKAEIVAAGKKATALVRTDDGFGSAFCVDASGFFITNEHVVEHPRDGTVGLIINAGERDERALSARIVGIDGDADLALLQTSEAGPFVALSLGSSENLSETAPVTVFGYPFGTDLALKNQRFPNVSVSSGTITALRKNRGQLESIQLDAVLNPGNSGGPVLDAKGEVIGIVESGIEGAGINFAIPVARLDKLIGPRVVFEAAPIPLAELFSQREFRFRVVSFAPKTEGDAAVRVSVTLRVPGNGAQIFQAQRVGQSDVWSVRARVMPTETRAATPAVNSVGYRVLITRGNAVVGDVEGNLNVSGAPKSAVANPGAPVLPAVTAPVLGGDKTVVPLPAPFDEVAVGGGGRYLILNLPSLRKLAVFDVSAGKIVKFLAVEEPVWFAAGAQKLVVVPDQLALIQRYDLQTFERDLTVVRPLEGEIRNIALGDASNGPLMLISFAGFAKSNTSFYDLGTLQKLDIESDTRRDWGSSWKEEEFQVRASADGQTFAGWMPGLSPSGLRVLRIRGDKAEFTYEHESVGYVLPGADGTLFYTGEGFYTSDLKPIQRDDKTAVVPAQGGSYYLGLNLVDRWSDKGSRVMGNIYTLADKRLLAPLPNLDELAAPDRFSRLGAASARDRLTIEKRLHFYPAANLLVTLPYTNDQIVLRRFNVTEVLDKAGVDYLLINSSPPLTARRGQLYSYQLEVKSKRGGVVYSVESGPPGLAVSASGLLQWKVPANYAAPNESVILLIRDAAEQQRYQSFTVALAP